jgi:hypothetical protein
VAGAIPKPISMARSGRTRRMSRRRIRCTALPQGTRQGSQALLHRPWFDGEPPWPSVDACLTPADGHAERVAALATIEPRADRPRANTLGADKAYDAEDFVNELRSMTVTPHVAQNTSGRSSAIDARTTRHGGDAAIAREMVVGPVLEYANLSYLSTAAALGNRHANRRLCTSNPMYVISFIRPALHA